MELTREQINEAKNFPTEKIKAKSKELKEIIRTIEATKMESDARKPGMPSELAKEIGERVTGPIATIRKKLKETVDSKRETDDLRANLATKKILESLEKELKRIKEVSVKLNRKVASELTKREATKSRADAAHVKGKEKYEAGKKKKEQETKFMKGHYAESVDFKKRVRSYLSLNEMAMKHFGPESAKKYSKEELAELFNKTAVESLASTYVKNARAEGMEDTKIAQGLGATLRGMEDKDKVAKVKEAVKAKLELKKKEDKKKEEKKEDK